MLVLLEVSDASKRPPMWTPAARAQLARDRIPYATSLTDAEWAVVAPFMPPACQDRAVLDRARVGHAPLGQLR